MPRIRDTDLYKNTVEGKDGEFKARLLKELAIVKKDGGGENGISWGPGVLCDISLMTAFTWASTPQGAMFWGNVYYDGVFP